MALRRQSVNCKKREAWQTSIQETTQKIQKSHFVTRPAGASWRCRLLPPVDAKLENARQSKSCYNAFPVCWGFNWSSEALFCCCCR